MRTYILIIACLVMCLRSFAQNDFPEQHRPLIHFSPREKWMNDPNGLVYYKGTYHLFYQYYPDSTVWGPMHWGHATSRDMIRWKHQPIALYPDSLGYIFSGSAVVDFTNSTGFGSITNPALIAMFTYHDPAGEKAGRNDYQYQGIAYSLDNGTTWTKYKGNPVLKSPGIADFRDPKLMWYAPRKQWIVTLAVKDHLSFYSSPDLIHWKKESDFGQTIGAHGGVWECPDLFQLETNGKKHWVLIVNLNPGGPNGGSATQYFVGNFDGRIFTPYDTLTRWLDYGPDEYAGVTWSNTGNRRLFIGWMSNWLYANVVPTRNWRNAMTVPRELALKKIANDWRVTSLPVKELNTIQEKTKQWVQVKNSGTSDLSKIIGNFQVPCRLDLDLKAEDFSLVLSNGKNESVQLRYSKERQEFSIDRSISGNTSFQQDFAGIHKARRFSTAANIKMTLIVDVSSLEMFADEGLTTMTEIFFPGQTYNKLVLEAPGIPVISRLQYATMRPFWK